MGGFGGMVFRGIEEGAEKLAANKQIQHETMESVARITSKIFSIDATATGKSGAMLKDKLKNQYEPTFQKYLGEYTQKAKQTGGQIEPYKIRTQASNQARADVFGDHDQVLAGITHWTRKEHGEEKAKNLVDQMGIYFHDQVYQPTGQGSRPGQMTSKLTSNLSQHPLTEDIGFRLSPYKAPGDGERNLQKYMAMTFAFKAGLAHVSTRLNSLMSQSTSSFLKAQRDMFLNKDMATHELLSTGQIGQEIFDAYAQEYAFKASKIAQYAPGSVGEFIHKNFIIPGFSQIRKNNIIFAGIQGKYRAFEIGDALVNGSNRARRLAEIDAKYLGMDAKKIYSQGGVLTDDVQKAMYHNVQNTTFLTSARSRVQIATSTPLTRLVTMYHSYGSMQAKFMLETINKELLQKHDPVSVFKLFATMGVIAPAAGNAIYGLEQMWRGKEWDDPAKYFSDREKAFYDATDLFSKLEAYTHLAGLGVLTTYGRGAGRFHLAQSMLGPVGSASSELAEDVVKASPYMAHPTARQLVKDIAHDTPSAGIGAILAERALPTEKPQPSRNRSRSRKAPQLSWLESLKKSLEPKEKKRSRR